MADNLNRKRLSSVLVKWKEAAEKTRSDALQGDRARAFFRQRSALKVWKEAFVKRREERAAAMARLDTLRSTFDGLSTPKWHEFCLHGFSLEASDFAEARRAETYHEIPSCSVQGTSGDEPTHGSR